MKKLLLTGFLTLTLAANSYAGMCGFFGFGCTPAPISTKVVTVAPAFVPSFENVNVVVNTTRGSYIAEANNTYFADEATAQAVAKRFGALRVEYRESIQNLGANYLYADGVNKGKAAIERVLIFGKATIIKNNVGEVAGAFTQETEINAGVLADYFRRMPEKDFPAYTQIYGQPPVETHYLALAEQYVWRVLLSVGQTQPLFFSAPVPNTNTI